MKEKKVRMSKSAVTKLSKPDEAKSGASSAVTLPRGDADMGLWNNARFTYGSQKEQKRKKARIAESLTQHKL